MPRSRIPIVRQFSVKANDVPLVIGAVAARGFGANVVSRGEWAAATRAGVPDDRITLEGVGKTSADLRAAVRAAAAGHPLRWIAIESPEEAEELAAARRRAGVRLDVLYRLNPDVAPETQAGLAVGAGPEQVRDGRVGDRRARSRPAAVRTVRSARGASTCTSGRSSARSMPGVTPSARAWR